jgi:hypothetical protein
MRTEFGLQARLPRHFQLLTGTARRRELSGRLQNRQNITCWALEPGNCWPVSAENSARVCLQAWFVVDFESDSALVEWVGSVIAVKPRIEAEKYRAEAARLRDELAQAESQYQSDLGSPAP